MIPTILANWSCFVSATIFLQGLTSLEGKPYVNKMESVKHEFRQKFWPVDKAGLLLWPLTQAINFAFITPRFRMVYIGVVGFCWINILSYIKHKVIHYIFLYIF